jgi:hypothetical protein
MKKIWPYIAVWMFSAALLSELACKELKYAKSSNNQEEKEFSVLAWNIWHGANNSSLLEDGRPHAINIIRELNPDIVILVETYGSGKMIADSLGYYFHLIAPENTPPDDKRINLSIMSRFPLGERYDFYDHFNIGGIEVFINPKNRVNVFAVWLNYQPWEDDPASLGKTPEELIEWEISGTRKAELETILSGLKPFMAISDSVPLILGGDFNIWSHLDWREESAKLHNGLAVNWWTTSTLEKHGFIDSYRLANPSVLTHPGITWDMPEVKDEHRIDYIFHLSPLLEVTSSEIGKTYFNENIRINNKHFMFPSDHGYVHTFYRMKSD